MTRAKFTLLAILLIGIASGTMAYKVNKMNRGPDIIFVTTIFNMPAFQTVYGTVTAVPFASTTQRYYVTFFPGELASYYTYIYIDPNP